MNLLSGHLNSCGEKINSWSKDWSGTFSCTRLTTKVHHKKFYVDFLLQNSALQLWLFDLWRQEVHDELRSPVWWLDGNVAQSSVVRKCIFDLKKLNAFSAGRVAQELEAARDWHFVSGQFFPPNLGQGSITVLCRGVKNSRNFSQPRSIWPGWTYGTGPSWDQFDRAKRAIDIWGFKLPYFFHYCMDTYSSCSGRLVSLWSSLPEVAARWRQVCTHQCLPAGINNGWSKEFYYF